MESKQNKKNHYPKIILILGIILFLIYAVNLEKKPDYTQVKINQNTIYAKVADTENERSMGLSYTKSLEKNSGMLFIFDGEEIRNFWMRDMNFNIDIIWINADRNVVGFFENVSTSTYNKTNPQLSKIFSSPEDTKYVLEVPAGTIENVKIKVGDVLDFDY